jgi:signal peptidase I
MDPLRTFHRLPTCLRHQRPALRAANAFAAIGVLFLLLVFAALRGFFWNHPYANLKAFRGPSISMGPTICENDRILVAMDAYKKAGRGDLILFNMEAQRQNFRNRIIGTAGDSVASGRGGTLLVNRTTL